VARAGQGSPKGDELTADGIRFGSRLLATVKAELGPDWAGLEADARSDISDTLEDIGDLTIRRVSGEDIDAEFELAMSTIADWKFVGASAAQRAVHAAIISALKLGAEFMLGALKSIAKV